jgi:hypothetical protein
LLVLLLLLLLLLLQQLGVGPQENEALIPVMADILSFSQADHDRIAAAQVCVRARACVRVCARAPSVICVVVIGAAGLVPLSRS